MQKLDLQEGATCHTTRVTMDLLRDEFCEHFISRSGSWDLTPFDYFLYGYVKAYENANLLTAIGNLTPKVHISFS